MACSLFYEEGIMAQKKGYETNLPAYIDYFKAKLRQARAKARAAKHKNAPAVRRQLDEITPGKAPKQRPAIQKMIKRIEELERKLQE